MTPRPAPLPEDAHGVRLGIPTAAGRRAVRRAPERRPTGGPGVSRAARAHLDGGRPAVLVFLARVTGLCAHVSTPVRTGRAT
ncbi:hypothetical protein ABTY20_00365 [Streptomyces sp. NPDC126497]|uniref:hypothetical protein n=1 Tax=Streptomyces sp. NPDC126497 TaxID=3155313 RepID=UPI0033329A0E